MIELNHFVRTLPSPEKLLHVLGRRVHRHRGDALREHAKAVLGTSDMTSPGGAYDLCVLCGAADFRSYDDVPLCPHCGQPVYSHAGPNYKCLTEPTTYPQPLHKTMRYHLCLCKECLQTIEEANKPARFGTVLMSLTLPAFLSPAWFLRVLSFQAQLGDCQDPDATIEDQEVVTVTFPVEKDQET